MPGRVEIDIGSELLLFHTFELLIHEPGPSCNPVDVKNGMLHTEEA